MRLEQYLGQQVQRPSTRVNPYKAGDWIDANGDTYDAVGPLPNWSYFNFNSFTGQIGQHLNKQGVGYVIVDITGLDPADATRVRAYIGGLPQGRLIVFPR